MDGNSSYGSRTGFEEKERLPDLRSLFCFSEKPL